jgi:hypothetical protein
MRWSWKRHQLTPPAAASLFGLLIGLIDAVIQYRKGGSPAMQPFSWLTLVGT